MPLSTYPGGIGATNGEWREVMAALGPGDLTDRIAGCLTEDPGLYVEIDLSTENIVAVGAALD